MVMKATHCFWSAVKPCFDIYVRRKNLLEASPSPEDFIFGHIIPYPTRNYHDITWHGGTLSVINEMIWHNENNPLGLECVRNSRLKAYFTQVGNIWRHIVAPYMSFWAITIRLHLHCQKPTEMPDLESTLSLEVGVAGDKLSHPLLLKYCKTLLWCICYKKEPSGGIW